jgi:low temperature requirement protein LtrA
VSTGAYATGTALWLASLAVPEPARYVVWVAAILLEASVPWLFRRTMAGVPTHASHLPERFGLFTIIVLGESLVAVVLGLDSASWGAATAVAGLGGFVVAALLWWVYFDVFEHARLRVGLKERNTFIYGHLPVALGLTLCGVGIKKAILATEEAEVYDFAAWAVAGGAALMLVGVAVIGHVALPARTGPALALRLAAAALLLVLAALHGVAAPAAFVVAVALVLAALAGSETARRTGRP